VDQLGTLAVSGEPSLEPTDGSFHPSRPELTRQDYSPEGAKHPGIEIGDCKWVKPARKEGERHQAGDLKQEPAAGECHFSGKYGGLWHGRHSCASPFRAT
jgi:hypothetical protein